MRLFRQKRQQQITDTCHAKLEHPELIRVHFLMRDRLFGQQQVDRIGDRTHQAKQITLEMRGVDGKVIL